MPFWYSSLSKPPFRKRSVAQILGLDLEGAALLAVRHTPRLPAELSVDKDFVLNSNPKARRTYISRKSRPKSIEYEAFRYLEPQCKIALLKTARQNRG